MKHFLCVSLANVLVSSSLSVPAFAESLELMPQPPSLAHSLWLPAKQVEDIAGMQIIEADGSATEFSENEKAQMIASACIEQGFALFQNGVWHPLALDGPPVDAGALCQRTGSNEALCETMTTDIVAEALAPLGTPRESGFFLVRWDDGAPDRMEMCMAGQCTAMTACEPLIEDVAAQFGEAGEAEMARIRQRLAESIPLIEAEGIDVSARAGEAGVDLTALIRGGGSSVLEKSDGSAGDADKPETMQ
ncbi:hypothetical protein [Fulvimarina sp. MAC8]|uniref:hypothetical protein n=1 Tax=Fulvimarina sp. MAC8 TaxID=3162874 RepID=UPI0032EB5624